MASTSDLMDDYKGDVDFDFFETPRDDISPKKGKETNNTDNQSPKLKQNGRRHSSESDSATDSRSESDREMKSGRSNRSDASSILTIEARIPVVEMRASLEAGSETDSDTGKDSSRKTDTKMNDKPSITRTNSSSGSKSKDAWSKESPSSGGTKTGEADKGSHSRKRGTERKKNNTKSRRHSDDSGSSYSDSSRSSSRTRSTYSSVTDSRSETDSDVTEVSPLASPDLSPTGSPRRKVNDKVSPRRSNKSRGSYDKKSKSSQKNENSSYLHKGSGDAPPSRGFPRGQEGANDLKTGDIDNDAGYDDPDFDTDRMNLRLLMQAVLEMDKDLKERQERLKASRRVMGPNQQARGAQPHGRKNFSFNNDKVKEIDRENDRLLKKILSETSVKDGQKKKKKPSIQPPPVKRVTNATINRQRQQRVIEQENLAMLKRLESIKPTKGMSREDHLTSYYQQQSYGVPLHGAAPSRKSRPSSSAYGSALSSKSTSMSSLRSATSLNGAGSPARNKRSKRAQTDTKPAFEPGTGRWSFKPERHCSDDEM